MNFLIIGRTDGIYSSTFPNVTICAGYAKDTIMPENERGGVGMSEKSEIIFMQVRMMRLASEEWKISIQKTAALFDRYNIFKFIEDCYGVFHMEGDPAVFEEIKVLLKNKGVDVNAAVTG